MIESAVRQHLITSGLTNTFLGIAPKGTVEPYQTVHLISHEPYLTHQGQCGLKKVTIQVSCFAPLYSTAREKAQQAISSLNILVPLTVEVGETATEIKASLFQSDFHQYEEDTALHHVGCRFIIHYTE